MKENILVCVSNMRNAESLIQRGHQLSNAFGGKCLILCVRDEAEDDLDYDWQEKKETLDSFAKQHQATLLLEWSRGRKISTIISNVCSREKGKQIVLGQPARSRWDVMVHGSIINELFSQLDGVDLHIVEVSKESAPQEKQYDKGVKGFLVQDGDGYELVLSNPPAQPTIEGLFFRGQATEFQNGLFKVANEHEIIIYKVSDGKVSLENTSILKR